METDELSQSEAPTLTSQDTRITRSTNSRLSPTLPPGTFHRPTMRQSQSQKFQTLGEPTLTPDMSRRLDQINRSLHLYEDNLAPSRDPEHVVLQSYPTPIQDLVRGTAQSQKSYNGRRKIPRNGARTNRYQHGTGGSIDEGVTRSSQPGYWKDGWTRHPSNLTGASHITPPPNHTSRRSVGNG